MREPQVRSASTRDPDRRRTCRLLVVARNKSDANLYLKSGIRNTALPQPGKGRGRLSMLGLHANWPKMTFEAKGAGVFAVNVNSI